MNKIAAILCCIGLLSHSIPVIASPGNTPSNANNSMVFVENKGQITDQYGMHRTDIDHKLQAGAMTVFIGKQGLHYQWSSGQNQKIAIQHRNSAKQSEAIDIYRMDVELVGSSPAAEMIQEEAVSYYENYYGPAFPKGTVAHSYRKITYRDVYPHIDWVIYVNSGVKSPKEDKDVETNSLKYDFVVHEGGDVHDIQLRYEGATDIMLTDGAITATTPFGSIIEAAPYSYEAQTGKKIDSRFLLQDNVLHFNTVAHNGTLVIDPLIKLEWATYYGGTGNDGYDFMFGSGSGNVNGYLNPARNDIAADMNSNVYLAGNTSSAGNIATTGAYQSSISTNGDAFIVKLNSSGQRQWASYYGGTDIDGFFAVCTDASGNIYTGGYTSSTGMASTGAFHTSISGTKDGFFVKFNAAGQRIWASYFGGTNSDEIESIATDGSNLYLGGSTSSGTGLATAGAFLTTYSPGPSAQDVGFLARFNTSGQQQWATYYGGGTNGTLVYSLACDVAGNIYGGGSGAGGSLGTYASFTSIPTPAATVGFAFKFNNLGQRIWGRFLNPLSPPSGNGGYIARIAVDEAGNVYAGGGAVGGDATNLFSPGAFISTGATQQPGFLIKLSGLNGDPIWGTLLPRKTDPCALATDNNGHLYVGGYVETASPSLSSTGAYLTTMPNGGGGFFCRFDTAGHFQYGSYFGGNGARLVSMAFCNNTGQLFMSGFATSSSNISFGNPHQTTFGGGTIDAFVASTMTDTTVYIMQPFTDTLFCAGDSIHVPYGVTSNFQNNNFFTLQLSDASGSFVSPQNIGSVTSNIAGIIDGRIPLTAIGTGYRVRIVAVNPARISLNDSFNIRIKPLPAGFSASSNVACTGDTLKLFGASSTAGVSWAWAGPSFGSASKDTIRTNLTFAHSGDYILTATLNGCSIRDTETVLVKQTPSKPATISNSPVCTGATLSLNAGALPGGSYSWAGPNSFSASTGGTTRPNMTAGDAGNYTVAVNVSGCIARDTVNVIVKPLPTAPVASSNSPVCIGSSLNLSATTIAGTTYEWNGPAGYSSTVQMATRSNILSAHAGVYTVKSVLNGCYSAAANTTVNVVPGPTVSIYPNPNDTICAGSPATMVAVPGSVNAGLQYQWYKNSASISGATGKNYPASGIVNKDTFFVTMLDPGSACNTPIASNSFVMTVMPQAGPPSVSITVTPDTNVWPDQQLSFIANVTNCNGTSTYQWYKDGKPIQNATTNPWPANHLSSGSQITCVAKCHGWCPVPDSALSNTLTMHVDTKVGSVANNNIGLSLYPNPNNGKFIVKTMTLQSKYAEVQIVNAIGQVIYKNTLKTVGGSVNQEIDLNKIASGIYVLRITANGYTGNIRFTIQN